MSITFPVTPPTAFKTQAVTWKQISVVSFAISPFTGNRQAQPMQGQYWEFDLTLPPLLRANAQAVAAFLWSLNGPQGTFYYGPVLDGVPLGVGTGSPVVNGANQSGQDVATRGWTPNTTGILKAGDWVQVGQYLHRNLVDVNSDSSGNATLSLWPNLRPAILDGTTIITRNPVGIFYLINNPTYDVSSGQIFSFKISAREAL